MTSIKEVIDLWQLLASGRAVGACTALLGCGIGPLRNGGARRGAVAAMVKLADVCILRDQAGARQARRLGRARPVLTAPDPAFLWSRLQRSNTERRSKPLAIALALRDWPLEEYAFDLSAARAQHAKGRFEFELVRLVETLQQWGDVEIDLVCMHSLPVGGDDRDFYRRLLPHHPELLAQLAGPRPTPGDVVKRLQDADAIVAMRFHSCVFALGLGKPFLALDYTRGGKIAGLLGDTGNLERLVSPEQFDGRQSALRLRAEIAAGGKPRLPSLAEGEEVYRHALRALAQVVAQAPSSV